MGRGRTEDLQNRSALLAALNFLLDKTKSLGYDGWWIEGGSGLRICWQVSTQQVRHYGWSKMARRSAVTKYTNGPTTECPFADISSKAENLLKTKARKTDFFSS
jgi:hypothetical protein